MKRNLILALLCALSLLIGITQAQAATRAWLDREQVAVGEAVTLNIETDQASASPDLSPLMADFALEGQSNSRSVQWVNGKTQARTTYVVTMAPKREGSLVVPALQVGSERSEPVTLRVSAAPEPSAANANSNAYLETEVDDSSPYVQQSVGVTLRLLYALPLASGQLDLDTPEGASLQRVGEDVQSVREVDGKRYNVVERKFLLVPERSGTLKIPAPRFVGRGAGGWMDDFLGGNSRELRATGTPKSIEVRAQPDNAPQPWLPLRDLRLRYVAVPQSLRAGEAAELVVEAIAQGATQSQMPELSAPVVAGAQVFAEPPQYDETFVGGTPQVKLTRRFSIVPNAAGTLVVPGMKLAWWDVRAGEAKTAALQDLSLDVAAGTGNFSAPAPAASSAVPSAETGNGLNIPGGADGRIPVRVWVWLAVGFAGLWLLTLVWALWRRRQVAAPSRIARTQVQGKAVATPTHTLTDLKRALDTGSLNEVGEVLCGMSTPPSLDLDALLTHLDSPVQRNAVEQLRRARWADGDGTHARIVLREAFRNGPTWRATQKTATKQDLPPLYPTH